MIDVLANECRQAKQRIAPLSRGDVRPRLLAKRSSGSLGGFVNLRDSRRRNFTEPPFRGGIDELDPSTRRRFAHAAIDQQRGGNLHWSPSLLI